jgi:hypothetical protein
MPSSRRARRYAQSQEVQRARVLLALMLVPLALLTVVGAIVTWPHKSAPDLGYRLLGPEQKIYPGRVDSLRPLDCDGPDYEASPSGNRPTCGSAKVTLVKGPDKGTSFSVDLPPETYLAGLPVGTTVRLVRTPATPDYSLSYTFYDVQRGRQLLLIAAAFAVVVVAVARLRGARALVGLLFAFGVLAKFVIPALLLGRSGPLVGAIGASLIMFVVLYLAHGPSLRTSSALAGTLFGLAITAGLGTWAIGWTHLSGGGTVDDSAIDTIGGQVHLTGLLICGVIIAGLGVLTT